MGPGEGVGDLGAEGRAAPGRVWEALAVTARGRDTPEPPLYSPRRAVIWQPRVEVKRVSLQQVE